MLSSTYAKNILNALFCSLKSDKDKGNVATFSETPYLALFTTMPNSNGTGFAEPTSSEYARILLTNKGPYGNQMMGSATSKAGVGKHEGKIVSLISNQDLIVFPEAATAPFGTVVGFGIMSSTDATSASFWGEFGYYDEQDNFVPEAITINKGEIPIIRTGDLEIYFV